MEAIFFLTVENVSYCLINYLYLLKVFKIKIELHYVPSAYSSLQYFHVPPLNVIASFLFLLLFRICI